MGTLLSLLLAGAKAVLRFVVVCLKIVYSLLKFFKIRLLALYLLVTVILHFTLHPFEGFGLAYFFVGLFACLLLTLYGWARPIRERQKRLKLKRREQEKQEKERETEREEKERASKEHNEGEREEKEQKTPKSPKKGKCYRVEGHPEFVFWEFPDRYELYRDLGGEFEYIRTDYK